MSDDQIVMHCAATLRDRKAGSLFAAEYHDRQSLYKEIAELNARLSSGNIRTMVLGFTKKRALVYLYRPNRLAAALSDATAQKILQKSGYDTSHTGACLTRLIRRMKDTQNFPHEIGLFLGYPSCEVEAFIQNDRPCVFAGAWKVYCDAEYARKCFRTFRDCTLTCRQKLSHGIPLEEMMIERKED